MWVTQLQTDRKIPANKPDIVVRDKKLKQRLLIDVSIPSDYSITQKGAENILKYKDSQIETPKFFINVLF